MRWARCDVSAAVRDGKSVFNPAIVVFVVLAMLVAPMAAQTVTAWHQPTPYAAGRPGAHLTDGWITNVYYGQKFVTDDKLEAGGWGDIYRSFVKFDTTGLPKNVTLVALWLAPFAKGDASTPTGLYVYRPTTDWGAGVTWSTQPGATYLGGLPAPTPGQWFGINITSFYTGWQTGTLPNYGFRFDPKSNANSFTLFRSSRYAGDGQRPLLQLNFTPPVPVPNFKLPLPGDVSYRISTEAGGYDCKGKYDPYHAGTNYYSIDFSWANKDAWGNQKYAQPSYGGAIPVLAAAAGRVMEVGLDPSHPNGFYVVIDHDSDNDVGTGFSTRYLHLKYAPDVYKFQDVKQGDRIGWMGATGAVETPTSDHLHFGVRYRNDGSVTRSELSYVTVDGWLLRSIHSECSGPDYTGDTYIRYYRSSNKTY